MNSLFNPNSGADSTKELVPDGTLAFAVVSMSDKGLANSQSTGGEYANLVITLEGAPPIGKRKVFHMLANPLDHDNSEAWRKMAISAITRILEACGTFDYESPDSYKIFDFDGVSFSHMLEHIEGQSIAVEIGIQKGQDGHADKNVVKTFLTPSKEKSSKRGRQLWDILISGGTTSKVEKAPAQAPAATSASPLQRPAVGPAAAARHAISSGIVAPAPTPTAGKGIGLGGAKPSGGIGAPKWANRPAANAPVEPAADPVVKTDSEPPAPVAPEAEAPRAETEVAKEKPVSKKKEK
ncbi:hypothetical protein UFOVP806_21 [uncultured Caudovirales phage]|uniref:Uncharacterized protein n=1 Tax=uncultured Caudovirales phage TaxID=2100421 RepID=A0A6J5P7J7_9CAUD|nr:hypothetical protein UFOVP806_21 [uncultured Caudovirales phage]